MNKIHYAFLIGAILWLGLMFLASQYCAKFSAKAFGQSAEASFNSVRVSVSTRGSDYILQDVTGKFYDEIKGNLVYSIWTRDRRWYLSNTRLIDICSYYMPSWIDQESDISMVLNESDITIDLPIIQYNYQLIKLLEARDIYKYRLNNGILQRQVVEKSYHNATITFIMLLPTIISLAAAGLIYGIVLVHKIE